ncbi:MAG: YceI family protein [Longimicrobiales bacterium]
MKTRNLTAVAAVLLGSFSLAAVQDATWKVDNAHSAVTFSVRHFFTPVKGQFDQFEAQVVYDPEAPENSSVRVTIPVASINTSNERRDAHLESPDFFEAEKYPAITFVSERVTRVSDTELLVRGALTIKDQTRQVDLPVTLLGIADLAPEMQQMFGGIKQVASFEAKLTLDRRDFGVGVGNWAATAVVGKDVEIVIAVEANR